MLRFGSISKWDEKHRSPPLPGYQLLTSCMTTCCDWGCKLGGKLAEQSSGASGARCGEQSWVEAGVGARAEIHGEPLQCHKRAGLDLGQVGCRTQSGPVGNP